MRTKNRVTLIISLLLKVSAQLVSNQAMHMPSPFSIGIGHPHDDHKRHGGTSHAPIGMLFGPQNHASPMVASMGQLTPMMAMNGIPMAGTPVPAQAMFASAEPMGTAPPHLAIVPMARPSDHDVAQLTAAVAAFKKNFDPVSALKLGMSPPEALAAGMPVSALPAYTELRSRQPNLGDPNSVAKALDGEIQGGGVTGVNMGGANDPLASSSNAMADPIRRAMHEAGPFGSNSPLTQNMLNSDNPTVKQRAAESIDTVHDDNLKAKVAEKEQLRNQMMNNFAAADELANKKIEEETSKAAARDAEALKAKAELIAANAPNGDLDAVVPGTVEKYRDLINDILKKAKHALLHAQNPNLYQMEYNNKMAGLPRPTEGVEVQDELQRENIKKQLEAEKAGKEARDKAEAERNAAAQLADKKAREEAEQAKAAEQEAELRKAEEDEAVQAATANDLFNKVAEKSREILAKAKEMLAAAAPSARDIQDAADQAKANATRQAAADEAAAIAHAEQVNAGNKIMQQVEEEAKKYKEALAEEMAQKAGSIKDLEKYAQALQDQTEAKAAEAKQKMGEAIVAGMSEDKVAEALETNQEAIAAAGEAAIAVNAIKQGSNMAAANALEVAEAESARERGAGIAAARAREIIAGEVARRQGESLNEAAARAAGEEAEVLAETDMAAEAAHKEEAIAREAQAAEAEVAADAMAAAEQAAAENVENEIAQRDEEAALAAEEEAEEVAEKAAEIEAAQAEAAEAAQAEEQQDTEEEQEAEDLAAEAEALGYNPKDPYAILGTIPDDADVVAIEHSSIKFPLKTFDSNEAQTEAEAAALAAQDKIRDDIRGTVTAKEFDTPLNVIKGIGGFLNVPENAENMAVEEGSALFSEAAKAKMEKEGMDTSALEHKINTGEREDMGVGLGYYVGEVSGMTIDMPSPSNPDPPRVMTGNGRTLDVSMAQGLDIVKGILKLEAWKNFARRVRPTVSETASANEVAMSSAAEENCVSEAIKRADALYNTKSEIITNASGDTFIKVTPAYGVTQQIPYDSSVFDYEKIREKCRATRGQVGITSSGQEGVEEAAEETAEETGEAKSLNVVETQEAEESKIEKLAARESKAHTNTQDIVKKINAFDNKEHEEKATLMAKAEGTISNDEFVETKEEGKHAVQTETGTSAVAKEEQEQHRKEVLERAQEIANMSEEQQNEELSKLSAEERAETQVAVRKAQEHTANVSSGESSRKEREMAEKLNQTIAKHSEEFAKSLNMSREEFMSTVSKLSSKSILVFVQTMNSMERHESFSSEELQHARSEIISLFGAKAQRFETFLENSINESTGRQTPNALFLLQKNTTFTPLITGVANVDGKNGSRMQILRSTPKKEVTVVRIPLTNVTFKSEAIPSEVVGVNNGMPLRSDIKELEKSGKKITLGDRASIVATGSDINRFIDPKSIGDINDPKIGMETKTGIKMVQTGRANPQDGSVPGDMTPNVFDVNRHTDKGGFNLDDKLASIKVQQQKSQPDLPVPMPNENFPSHVSQGASTNTIIVKTSPNADPLVKEAIKSRIKEKLGVTPSPNVGGGTVVQ